MSAPILQTPRLVLRQWRDDDLDAYAALNANPEVMEHYPSVLSRADSEVSARRIREGLAMRPFGLWAVEAPGAAPFVGYVGLAEPGFAAHFTPCIEIGWRLARDHWGKGYAIEAASAVCEYAFGPLGLTELVSFTVPANWRSRRVMESLGMRRTEAEDFQHPSLPAGHRLQLHVLYRMQRVEGSERAVWREPDRADGLP